MRQNAERKPFKYSMKNFFASGMLIGAVFVCLAGCGGNRNPSSEAVPAESSEVRIQTEVSGKKVGISFPSSEDSRWVRDGASLEEALNAQGCITTLVYSEKVPEEETKESLKGGEAANETAQENSGEAASGEGETGTQSAPGGRQGEDIKQLISSGCELLIVCPDGESSLLEALAYAKEAGIPVISYDRLITGSDAVNYYVSFDSYRMGQQQAEALASAIGMKVTENPDAKLHHIEFVAGDLGSVVSVQFFNGAYDILKTYLDAGALSVPSGQVTFASVAAKDWSADEVKARLEQILKDYYTGGVQLDGVLCPNDSTALGAIEAVKSSYSGKNKVAVTGWGADEENLAAIVDGNQTMTFFGNSDEEAALTAELAFSLLRGDGGDANLLADSDFPFGVIYDTASYDNGAGIVPSYLIEPEMITAGSLDKLTKSGRYRMDGKYPKLES